MSPSQRLWSATESTESPMTLQLRFLNSPSSLATVPSSVVHTGVKSFGCEKSTHQLLPIHSWKWIGPEVESCVKSGAISPRWMAMSRLLGLREASERQCGSS